MENEDLYYYKLLDRLSTLKNEYSKFVPSDPTIGKKADELFNRITSASKNFAGMSKLGTKEEEEMIQKLTIEFYSINEDLTMLKMDTSSLGAYSEYITKLEKELNTLTNRFNNRYNLNFYKKDFDLHNFNPNDIHHAEITHHSSVEEISNKEPEYMRSGS